MARPVAAPIAQTKAPWELQPGVSIASMPLTDGGIINVNDVTHGMILSLPREVIPPGAAEVIKNGRVHGNGTTRRDGTQTVGTKPDSNRVIGIFSIVHEDGSKNVCRVTVSTFHVWNGTSWIAFTVGMATHATGVLTLSANVSNGDTVTIGTKVYTFQTSLTNVDGNVLIGAASIDSLNNLIAAINLTAGAGTTYAAAMTEHPDVEAAVGVGNTMVVTANSAGATGSTIATTDVSTAASWSTSTLTIKSIGFKETARRVTATQLFGKIYLSFGIGDGLWEVDFLLRTVTRVADAPGGKFAVTFAERVILANIFASPGGHFPNAVQWSENSEPLDWTGEGAGFEDLISDSLGNEITGFVAMEQEAVLIRRQSIVHITRQPFNIAPFRFDTIIRGIGSDLPYTSVLTPLGIIFANAAQADVYLYRPGSFPVSLAAQHNQGHLHGALFADLAQAQHSEATYDEHNGEYHLGLIWATDNELISRRWICNIHRGYPVWSYDDSPTVTTLGAVLPPPAATTINALTGTINNLTGSIDSLSSRAVPTHRLYAGLATGEVIEFTHDADHDWDGTEFEFTFQAPNIGSPSNRRTMKDLEVTCSIPVTGSVTVEQSKDNVAWSNTKTATRVGATPRQKVRLPKTQITGDDLWWRIRSTAPRFKIFSWWARMMDKGEQQGGQQ